MGSCGTAAEIRKRVVVDDVMTHPFWSPYVDLAKKAGFSVVDLNKDQPPRPAPETARRRIIWRKRRNIQKKKRKEKRDGVWMLVGGRVFEKSRKNMHELEIEPGDQNS